MEELPEAFGLSEPMPCFEFNLALDGRLDNGRCEHCRKFLTVECEYIDHFLVEEDE